MSRPSKTIDVHAFDPDIAWPAGATPPAAIGLLLEAIDVPERVAITPYAPCVHLADIATAGLTTRYFSAIEQPAQVYARADWYRAWNDTAAAPPTHRADFSAGVNPTELAQSPPDIPRTLAWAAPQSHDRATSAPKVAGGAGDHFIARSETNAPAVRDGEVRYCVGWTIWLAQLTTDIETI